MKHIIVGTAGHIDHGKTALIEALTGINTDRLKEEKERGITIDLGFAYLFSPRGIQLGIVDVPGHERFIKNMLAGAAGIDLVLMVIAADEGVMPQTIEHLDICQLLAVKGGLIALTKVDLVDDEWLELVEADIREKMMGTFLENAPIIRTSTKTKEGLERLKEVLFEKAEQIEEKNSSGLFRLPIDRVFTTKGFGTVITGTLISGSISLGDPVHILPAGKESRVRTIQVHEREMEKATAGQRTAVNLPGVSKEEIQRGNVLIHPRTFENSRILNAKFTLLKSAPKSFADRERVRFHHGTSEIMGRIALLDVPILNPGESALVQIRLESPLIAAWGDRFVVRSYSPIRTIGGGVILDAYPVSFRKSRKIIAQELNSLIDCSLEERALYYIKREGANGIEWEKLFIYMNLPEEQLNLIIKNLLSVEKIKITEGEKKIISHEALEYIYSELEMHLKEYHSRNPLKSGMLKEELTSRIKALSDRRIFNLVLSELQSKNRIIIEDERIKSADFSVKLSSVQQAILAKMTSQLKRGGFSPPDIPSLTANNPEYQAMLKVLIDEGIVVKISSDIVMDAEKLQELAEKLIQLGKDGTKITVSQVKELTGSSRKYVIPLLEFFDAQGLTRREGDVRVIRKVEWLPKWIGAKKK